MPASPTPPPPECANCGAPIPRSARACPACGADERTGWRDTGETDYASLDLPDSAYDDDRPPASRRERDVNGLAWYWWAVAVSLLLLLALGALNLL